MFTFVHKTINFFQSPWQPTSELDLLAMKVLGLGPHLEEHSVLYCFTHSVGAASSKVNRTLTVQLYIHRTNTRVGIDRLVSGLGSKSPDIIIIAIVQLHL